MGGGGGAGCWVLDFTKLMQSHLPTKVEVEVEDELGNCKLHCLISYWKYITPHHTTPYHTISNHIITYANVPLANLRTESIVPLNPFKSKV